MKIPLHYGEGIVEIEVPEQNLGGFLQPKQHKSNVHSTDILSGVFRQEQNKIKRLVSGNFVGLLLPDGTRDLPVRDILVLLLPLLKKVKKILFFICTGSHEPQTPSNDRIVRTIHTCTFETGIDDYEIISHDCQVSPVSEGGSTQNGTEILYNSRLDQVDVFIVLSDVKHHYFAGYSNPIKNIVPGLCAFKTIEQNHSLTFESRSRTGVHPFHSDTSRQNNPLAVDQLEAMRSIVGDRPVWALTTISSSGLIEWAALGPASIVSSQAFAKADEWNLHAVKPVDHMIVSAGGLPHDVDLYMAQRALELTASVVRDGGEILFLAACPRGIGSDLTKEHFHDSLMRSPEAILSQKHRGYHLFEHKPYRFMKLINRLNRLWFYTTINQSVVKRMHMEPCAVPQVVVDSWLTKQSNTNILVVDKANKLFLTKDN